MASGEMFHLQGAIPWQEWIGARPRFPQMPGYGGDQLPQLKRLKARKLDLPCFERHQSTFIQGPSRHPAGLPPEAFSSHRLGAWPALPLCSSDSRCR